LQPLACLFGGAPVKRPNSASRVLMEGMVGRNVAGTGYYAINYITHILHNYYE
jgi:hypothetical protein